ncbi:GNAT family N-acetyltransferase [Cellulomonas oligotrophica]|uniref:Alcaligin biosynthesis protein n=1 Tax=Cellulomonas oligotrophica TaxID=931536 RepID=A0A7Y9FFG7_9CELL|nr:GNAT family N-acetyltransferase [Cellulomonas oligotrophica]NYD86335.1 penicillin amidase [Cellulomonas oligotrophica]GIG32774.1 alcaligin biosynthesis protein [Cellulomonas oligotrophica]
MTATAPDRVTAHLAALGRGGTVDERDLPGLGTLTTTVLDPDAELDVLHAWVTARGTQFWGLAELTREELRETYAYVDRLDHHHALLVRLDGAPVVLLQVYEPALDPVGEVYDVQPGDLGLHVLLGGRPAHVRGTGWTSRLFVALADVLFDQPGVRRLVGEPDARNTPMLRRALLFGAELGPEVDLPTKRARLFFVTR